MAIIVPVVAAVAVIWYYYYWIWWGYKYDKIDMPFAWVFTIHPALEVPKTSVRPIFSCICEGEGRGKLEGDFVVINST